MRMGPSLSLPSFVQRNICIHPQPLLLMLRTLEEYFLGRIAELVLDGDFPQRPDAAPHLLEHLVIGIISRTSSLKGGKTLPRFLTQLLQCSEG